MAAGGPFPGMRRDALVAALTPELHHWTAKVVWLLRGALAALALFALAVEPRYTTRPLLVGSALAGLGASLAYAFVPTRRPRTLKAAEAMTLLAVMAHVVGHAFGVYDAVWFYDKALHLFLPLVSVLVIYALSQATNWIWDWRKVSPFEVGVYVFSMAVAIGALWEIMEFGMDTLFGTEEQNGLADTMVDLIMDVLGAAVGAAIAAWVTRRGREEGMDAVSEAPKRPVPARSPTEAGTARE